MWALHVVAHHCPYVNRALCVFAQAGARCMLGAIVPQPIRGFRGYNEEHSFLAPSTKCSSLITVSELNTFCLSPLSM